MDRRKVALPDGYYAPAFPQERGAISPIPGLIRTEFISPEGTVLPWDPASLADMGMPVTTMHKYDDPKASENQIRSTGQPLPVQAITKTRRPHGLTHHKFWFRILRANAGHSLTSLRTGKCVGHKATLPSPEVELVKITHPRLKSSDTGWKSSVLK